MGFWGTAMDGIVGNVFGGIVTAGAVYATIRFERRSRAEAIEKEQRARVEALEFERLARTKTATTLAVTDLHRDAWDLLTAIDAGSEHVNPRQGVGTTYSVVLAHAGELWPAFTDRIRANVAGMFAINAELVGSHGEADRGPALSRLRVVVADIAELCRAWLEEPEDLEATLAADPELLRGYAVDPPRAGHVEERNAEPATPEVPGS